MIPHAPGLCVMLSMSGHSALARVLRSRAVEVRVTTQINDVIALLQSGQVGSLLIDQERGLNPALLAAAKAVVVIVISRTDSAALKLAALEAGATHHLNEPIDISWLADLLAPTVAVADAEKILPRVLAYARGANALAELVELIAPVCGEVLPVSDPNEALSVLRSERPDVVVLDVSNELQACALHRLLRADPLAQSLPMVLLADGWVDEFAQALGRFDHLLTVPIEPKHLQWQLQRVFAERLGDQADRVRLAVGPLAAPLPVAVMNVPRAAAVVAETPSVQMPIPKAVATPLDSHTLRRDALKAIQYSQMALDFQPIVSLRGDGVQRYEALLRLRGDDHLPLNTAAVFDALKGHPAALLLDRWVLSEALSVLRGSAQRVMFVNLSLDALTDTALLEWLAERLVAARIPPGLLVFDVGLAQLEQAPERVRQGVRRLRNLGCRAALQDTRLRKEELEQAADLGVSFIKADMDGSVAEMLSPAAQTALKSAAAAAHAAQIEPIACRVESPRLLPMLWSSSIELVQGYITQAPSSEMNFDFAQGIG